MPTLRATLVDLFELRCNFGILFTVVRLLFTVTDVFSIPGRGVVLLPELTLVGEERFRVGDPLMLRGPDGAEDIVRIGGLEFAKSVKREKCELVIMLLGKKKEHIPIGTEVWSVDKSRE